ncbi:Uncharacterized zinc metallopeptidase C1919.12c [Taphrina deformans PYCC 5710]|uniref:Peptide hydrolase n=1 Tax=Taphrina deformans (strain PYCC 5710 / ATCC 11124 / CBS 356.35 / IMI 108563 / JCM 9778 / NBRC 8474) TaxID=1097556 RepID=R4X6Q0_TAPDE|nr:Uncharacterized zinc metallopeptidase C1919.12c [Taphrina deformans PYCC 5710]|eukprot:CCG80871.1 Uncharacterized zinc metallopeptidase C1919.12c [Taphrina deformans PYCC 5710]
MRLPLFVSLVTLVAVFIVVIFQVGQLPSPSKESVQAYTRLQEIAKSPHPYNSYRNDDVRRFLKSIIEDECPSALDESDNSTTWVGTGMNRDVKISTYHEQTNLVIYLPSSRKTDEAVLLSAHYDSVSSGNGATDNGMGITVALALIKKHCKHSLPANIIFNINNAEEDGLFGAQAFLEHPRFAQVKSFINLEGAGAGGPAMLFRASGNEVAASYKGAKMPRSSIAGNDFFEQHLIQSQTDFVVYAPHVPGIDVAFFAPRSQYHTRRDSSKTASAWSIEHMLSAADHAMTNLAHTKHIVDNKSKKTVFFDFLGLRFFSFQLTTLLWFDLAILIASPILLGISFAIRSFFGKIKFVGVGRLFGSLLLQIAFVVGLSVLIAGFNPFIIHSSPLLYSATILLASFTANLFSTRLFVSRVKDQHDLSRIMSWELCFIWYILLIISSILSLVKGLGSTYIVTLNFVAAFVVALSISRPTEADQESTESSPLLRRDPLAPEIEESIKRDKKHRDYRSGTTWIIKYLILIPVPLIVCLWLLYSTVLPGLAQTLPDGSSGTVVYAIVGLFAVLAFFNLSPFFLSTSLSSALPSLLLLLIILSLTSVLKSPFDVKSPLKVYFKQVVDFDNPANSHVVIEGLPVYMESAVSTLALAQNNLNCTKGSTRSKHLNSCTFPAPVDSRLAKAGIATSIKRGKNGTMDRVLVIDTLDSRICDVNLEKSVDILAINGKTIGSKESHVRLYRRDWSKPFEITLPGDSRGVKGRVMCFWDDRTDGKIEAFDTVQAELPEWCEVTKRDTGLIWYSKKLTL